MSLKRPFVPKSDVKQLFTTTTTTIIVFNLFHYPTKALLLGMKCVSKHQDFLKIWYEVFLVQKLEHLTCSKNEMNRALGHFCAHIG